jgi:methyl-accepting chemotaxis protein
MEGYWTFSRKVGAGFLLMFVVALAVAAVSVVALREVVARKDHIIDVAAIRLVDTERLHAMSLRKATESRAYLMTRDSRYLDGLRDARADMREVLEKLRREVETDEGRRLVLGVDEAEAAHEQALQHVLDQSAKLSIDASGVLVEREVRPRRAQLDAAVDRLVERERKLLDEHRQESTEFASTATRMVLLLAGASAALAAVLAVLLTRTLSRQISGAVRHVESSSSELKAVAGQQATGAREQATAMTEITTTISELLATSRQISESAQRVSSIAADTAAGARTGDEAVQRSQDAVGTIRRQVELVVTHMLDLGRKSQQIGGVVEIINELAEQTNILAINATIEAAGAGESGRRFAAVAEEIRKLADRVAGSAKDIRSLIEEVRAAVNTTVMATEGGSKAVEAGARQFADLAAAFSQIARLVATTTDAAREIELSTKQQATAVEQVNLAIANVAQATREAETSSGQALQTATELANMSQDLARLVQSRAA